MIGCRKLAKSKALKGVSLHASLQPLFMFHGLAIPSVASKAGLTLNSSLLLSPVPLY